MSRSTRRAFYAVGLIETLALAAGAGIHLDSSFAGRWAIGLFTTAGLFLLSMFVYWYEEGKVEDE